MLLFRIAQETLHNVGRHAAASEARVSLHSDGSHIKLSIADNGRGFHLPKTPGTLATLGKMGLLGMCERASLMSGTLNVQSEPGKGTLVVVDVPARPAAFSR